MGGANEQIVEQKAPQGRKGARSGGTTVVANGQTIRFHESGGQVHFHDDDKGLKAAVPVARFWKAWQQLRDGELKVFSFTDRVNQTKLEVTVNGDAAIKLEEAKDLPAMGPTFRALETFVNATS